MSGKRNPHSGEVKPSIARSNIRPFLTWAWLSSGLEKSISPERLAAEHLFTIMEDIDRHLRRQNEHSYTCAPEATLAELQGSILSIQVDQQSIPRSDATNHAIYAPLADLNFALGTIQELSSPVSIMKQNALLEDATLYAQKGAVQAVLKEIVIITQDFVGLFIPCTLQHTVSKKIWGSLSSLIKSATAISTDQEERARSNYLIRPPDIHFMKKRKIDEPRQPLQSCSACREGHIYRTAQEASMHLLRTHFIGNDNLSLPQLAKFHRTHRHWVRTEDQVRKELFNKQQLRLLRLCLNYIKILDARADKIHQGLMLEERDDLAGYQLPNDLVDCFETTALFVMQSATALSITEAEMRRWQYAPGLSLEEVKTTAIETALDRLGELGQATQASMTRAEKTLALSDPETNMLSMGAAGPELLVCVLLRNVQRQQLLEGVDLDLNQLYQQYTSKLQYQINQFPRKRLLRDIHALQEELSVVQMVNQWQQKAFENFVRVLNYRSFENPTPSRIAMFPPEAEDLKVVLDNLRTKAAELEALENRTQYLREQLKQSVEILEEDHGKAILVFTMITTIFLPLSFVTSFFGMNTADIRNTNRSQGYFWAITVPVTGGIVFAAVLLAYHGDKLYDWTLQRIYRFAEHRSGSSIADRHARRERTSASFQVSPRAWNSRSRWKPSKQR
ncbi:hypothetical protein EK21DRAFT_51452 [Setomelanomma holmii]|uniref:DUF7896 domain-containing protein n=1 Tax=Setomelanomma holmii TaxID=210430 RepID=A0A9P4LSI1_9PLEO|nr:hypothetical protein EK21DRAFT_51452 [Setomelanomma holmii]